MLEESIMEHQPSNEELIRENRSLKRQLRNLESTFQRNKAMLAARTTVNNMLETEQQKMERNMSLLLGNSADIILLFDSDSRFSYYTRTFLAATGLTDADAITGKHFTEFFSRVLTEHQFGALQAYIDLAIERRDTVAINASVDLSGRDRPQEYDIQITPMVEGDGQPEAFMVLLHNITDIMRSKRQAESANIAKSQFLATMSHEMRTPMNAVLGMAAIGKAAADQERMLYCFDKIEDASQHLLGVINDILDVSKIEAGKLELSPASFEFSKLLQRVMNIINLQVTGKSQRLGVHIDENIPDNLIGDDQRLAQIITNLLGNAVKFTPEGGVIHLDARLLSQHDGLCDVQIAITDSGIGISPEQQARLFQPFHQAQSDTTRKFGGTGLGLAISKNIIKMMGGDIWVTSELDQGSTFTFTIQLEVGAGNDTSPGVGNKPENVSMPAVAGAAKPDFAGCCILLADDIEINREIVLALLEPTQLTIDCAENGEQALRMFCDAPDKYGMIFMDIQMPEMDGYEATRRIRACDHPGAQTIPIIAMTANVFREDVERSMEAGMNAHIGKPLDFDEVMQQLQTYL